MLIVCINYIYTESQTDGCGYQYLQAFFTIIIIMIKITIIIIILTFTFLTKNNLFQDQHCERNDGEL